MEKVSLSGKMDANMTASGSAESSPAPASTPTIMASAERGSGRTESAKSG